MRMQIRRKRLQDMYKSLGKDPNSKDLEMKTLVTDFDKVARKFVAKVRKGKEDLIHSRENILKKYGLRSS